MALSHSPSIITQNLVLCLDAANTKSYPGSGTTWNDLSSGGNNGTLRNSPTYSNDNSGKFVLDGVNTDISCGNNSSINFGTGDFTVSIWFRRFTNATNNLRLLSKAGNSDTADAANAGFAIYGGDNSVLFIVNATAIRVATTIATFSVNEWVNAVAVMERGANIKGYKNGVLTANSLATPAGSVSGTTSLFLGSNTGSNLFWAGEISNIQIYNRALTADEISQNYNALRSRYGL